VNVAVCDPSQGRYRSIAQGLGIEAAVFTGHPDDEPRDGLAFHWDRSTGSRQRLSSVAGEPTEV
jgi:hypothetical protein